MLFHALSATSPRGALAVKIAVVSDVHGNRQAFEAVLDAIAESDCQELWCLGDLVGYGADPDACVMLAHEHCTVCLAGNHDLGVTGTIPLEQFSRGAAIAAHWTRDTITSETLDFLQTLQPHNLDRRCRPNCASTCRPSRSR
jgi:predicted phosphodiesterase